MENYLYMLMGVHLLLFCYCGFMGIMLLKQKHQTLLLLFLFAITVFIFWECDILDQDQRLNKKPINQETQCS